MLPSRIFVCVITLALVGALTAAPSERNSHLEQRGPCEASIGGATISLRPLINDSVVPRFTTLVNGWHYSFNPCEPYDLPKDIFSTESRVCYHVALCRWKQENVTATNETESSISSSSSSMLEEDGTMLTHQTLGLHSSAEFFLPKLRSASMDANTTILTFRGLGEHRNGLVRVYLKCNWTMPRDESNFTIIRDNGNGDVTAELWSPCCCLDGCKDSSPGAEDKLFRTLLIIVVHLALLGTAIVVGWICYHRKRSPKFCKKAKYVYVDGEKQAKSGKKNKKSGKKKKASSSNPSFHFPAIRSDNLPVLTNPEIPEKQLNILRRLGGGVYGDTYLAEWKDTRVALKRLAVGIHQNQITPEILQNMIREVGQLSCHRHKNIIDTFGICVEMRQPYIVNEFLEGVNLRDYIAQHSLGWSQFIKFAGQVSDGLGFLHSRSPPVLHRDLRCTNVMVGSHEVIKVVDYGVIRLIQPVRELCESDQDCFCNRKRSACPASIRWTAPEVLQDSSSSAEPNYTCDVYSFGMTAWELVNGENPFHEVENEDEVVDMVLKGRRPGFPPDVLPEFEELVRECWASHIIVRPNFEAISERLQVMQGTVRGFLKRTHHVSVGSASSALENAGKSRMNLSVGGVSALVSTMHGSRRSKGKKAFNSSN